MSDFELIKNKTEYAHLFGNLLKLTIDSRLILVLGAGVSSDAGLPRWSELLEKLWKSIFSNDQVNLTIKDLRDNGIENSVIGQLLYDKLKISLTGNEPNKDKSLTYIESDWREKIRKYLYEDYETRILPKIKDEDFILKQFAPLIKKIPLTINYNFDDVVETLLGLEKGESIENPDRSNFHILFGNEAPSMINGNIYHPNGYVPHDTKDISSESIIFTESQFGKSEQETYIANRLMYYFQNYVCLFMGTSFQDPTLKRYLILNKRHNPGHYHYAIIKKDVFLDQKNLLDYLFDNLNVIPMVLTTSETAELGRALSLGKDQMESLLNLPGFKRVYYLVGPPGAGKTTMKKLLNTVTSVPEWLNLIPAEMLKNSMELNKAESEKVDNFVKDQVRKKSIKIKDYVFGTVLIDRSPIDAAAFPTKSGRVLKRITNFINIYESFPQDEKIVNGGLIYLTADPDTLSRRRASKRYLDIKNQANKKLDLNEKIFQLKDYIKSVYKIDTTNKSKADVVEEIAKIIFKNDYSPINLMEYLNDLKKAFNPKR